MPLDEFEFSVLKTIQTHHLIFPGHKVLVALSGGMDSMSLLNILLKLRQKLNCEIFAAHLNHMIRENAIRDEQFVYSYCKKAGVKIFVERFDVPKFCADRKIGIEEGARAARYTFLNRIAHENGIDLIALAHNLNDLVETILYRIVRGTGLSGIVCMKLKDENKIRPLLYFKREQIEAYIKRNNIPYVQDETNFNLKYSRNYIRHRIVPALKLLNSDLENAFSQVHFSGMMLENHVKRLIKKYSERIFRCGKRIIFYSKDMDEFEIIELVKYCAGQMNVDLNYRQIQLVVSKLNENSWSIDLSEDIAIKKGFDFFSIEKKCKFMNILKVGKPGVYKFNDWTFELSSEVKSNEYVFIHDQGGVCIRKRKAGEKIAGVKMKDMMIDSKIPAFLRDEMPVVCTIDRIIWVPYVYVDRCFKERKEDSLVLNLLQNPYSCILELRKDERRKMV